MEDDIGRESRGKAWNERLGKLKIKTERCANLVKQSFSGEKRDREGV